MKKWGRKLKEKMAFSFSKWAFSDSHIEFTVKNSTLFKANKIRNVIMTKIPVIAVKKVSIKLNDTVHHDDYLNHRISMIPILGDFSDGKSVKFVAELYNDTTEKIPVMSESLVSDNKELYAHPDIIITYLKPGGGFICYVDTEINNVHNTESVVWSCCSTVSMKEEDGKRYSNKDSDLPKNIRFKVGKLYQRDFNDTWFKNSVIAISNSDET